MDCTHSPRFDERDSQSLLAGTHQPECKPPSPTRRKRRPRPRALLYEVFDSRSRLCRRISKAILILAAFSFTPVTVWFCIVDDPFAPVPSTCGGNTTVLGTQFQGPTGSGFQNLFTVDRTFGSFSFSTAKFIDVIWDLLIARGMQFLTGWVSYSVLTRALLRAMELCPIPYNTFAGLALSGPTISAMYSVMTDLRRFQSPQVIFLLVNILLSMVYVVALPTLLTAITGYISTLAAFVRIPDTDQLVPTTALTPLKFGFRDLESNQDYCTDNPSIDPAVVDKARRQMTCCTPINCDRGVGEGGDKNEAWTSRCEQDKETEDQYTIWNGTQCTFNSNETFHMYGNADENNTFSCNEPLNFMISNISLDAWGALSTDQPPIREELCYKGRAYYLDSVAHTLQCVPTSDDLEYRWGFSTVLTSVVLILHVAWSLMIFALWLDAEIREWWLRDDRFEFTQIRGALILAGAAVQMTGQGIDELIVRPPREVDDILSSRDAAVKFELLND